MFPMTATVLTAAISRFELVLNVAGGLAEHV